ncbi:hypothetical protein [Psychroserpens mesophilus]|uniref:hypothetical protein n=1 Tax=Psychroserpens mesophilus TaxID=325473 RepID=UPI003D65C062
MSHFNICPSCVHLNNCVLTSQKDQVWSCSEFDDVKPNETTTKIVQQPEQILELV